MEPAAVGSGRAVVIGGGVAGLLAAWALREHAQEVVVVERDRYPDGPAFRAGVPQGRHAHLLLEGGHRVLDELMPGIRAELLESGATRVLVPNGLRWLSSAGWMSEYESDAGFLSCTRPLLDDAVLRRVRSEPRITLLEGTAVVGLSGTAGSLSGVRVRPHGQRDAQLSELSADMVVDASGRTSSLPEWLTELGCPLPPEERVDAGVAYATRLYRRRPDVDLNYSGLYLQTKAPDAPRLGVLLPVEDDRWIVSVGGMRGAEPEPGDAGFEKQLGLLRDPSLRDLLAGAEPLTSARGFRPGPGVRRRYDKRAPQGLVVVGDAGCTFNPVYGQGITVAVHAARALRDTVARHGGIGHEASRVARRAIAAITKDAWVMSSSEDVRFPTTVGGPSSGLTGVLVGLQHRYLDRVLARATVDPAVSVAFSEVMQLVTPPTALFRPSIVWSVLRGTGGGPPRVRDHSSMPAPAERTPARELDGAPVRALPGATGLARPAGEDGDELRRPDRLGPGRGTEPGDAD
ncbi:flavin-dependent dehydrogenase [Streptacidiphilus sp. MAP12-20]